VSWLESAWYPQQPPSLGTRALLAPLVPVAGCFAAGVAARNFLFDKGLLGGEVVAGLRVLSVGNLSVGGAGKTPVVAFLADLLLREGAKVAILSRGHGRTEKNLVRVSGPPWPSAEGVGDEPLLLARRLPGVQVWVGANRVALARQARAAGATVALLDDGFQHRFLARDADLVVLDEAVGLGNGHPLPWGPLREPATALRRASVLWLRVASAPAPMSTLPLGIPRVRARHAPVDVTGPDGVPAPLSRLAGARVVAFCGIARPSSFVRTLREAGAEVTGVHAFGDHHLFSKDELARLEAAATATRAQLWTTEKDAMRLPQDFPASVVRLGVSVLEGEEVLQGLLAGSGGTRRAGADAPSGAR
jgi:tetraacyldisaccharide 4'-kinase